MAWMAYIPPGYDMDLTYGWYDDGRVEVIDSVVVYVKPDDHRFKKARAWARKTWKEMEADGIPFGPFGSSEGEEDEDYVRV